jgi:D-methionine transport system ATP-binding protein
LENDLTKGVTKIVPGHNAIIEIRNISKTFHTKDTTVEALKNVTLTVEQGDIFGVIGYSGSGKSTLIRCVNRLETIDSGEILVSGSNLTTLSEKELRVQRHKIGMIFQQFNLLKNGRVFENIALPLKYERLPKKQIEAKVDELLQLIGLEDKKYAYPSQLSGGQQQRVAIARALANDPQILLCDEPTSALDPDTTHSILEFLKELNHRLNLTILLITHEMTVVKDICNNVAVLSDGEVVENGKTIEVFTQPQHEITKQFVNSLFEQEKIQGVIESPYAKEVLAKGGLIARLLFKGVNANDALISQVSRQFDIDISVIFGNIEIVQGQPIGNLYVAMSGDAGALRAAQAFIKEQGVLFEAILGGKAVE